MGYVIRRPYTDVRSPGLLHRGTIVQPLFHFRRALDAKSMRGDFGLVKTYSQRCGAKEASRPRVPDTLMNTGPSRPQEGSWRFLIVPNVVLLSQG